MTHPSPRLFVIDGSSFIFRAFFALRPRADSAGLASNAIYGFTNMMLRFVQQYRPEYLAFVLDAGRDNFRKRMSLDYKATRPEIPADLVAQLPSIREVLKALKVPLLELRGYEADDVIATLCKSLSSEQNCECIVVSNDKDLMQLVTDRVKLLDGARGRWISAAEVKAKFGVEPGRVVQVMGLMGDAIDNIRGVKGIGEKTAIALIRQFHSLENLFARLDEIEGSGIRGATRVRKALENGKEAAFLSRELVTLRSDAPIEIKLNDLRFSRPEIARLVALFAKLKYGYLAVS